MATETRCPCCGSAMVRDYPVVSLNLNTVSFGENTLQLTRREAELLSVLVADAPKIVEFETALQRVWGYDSTLVSLYLCASRLRAKLLPLGFIIRGVWGMGYRVERVGAAPILRPRRPRQRRWNASEQAQTWPH